MGKIKILIDVFPKSRWKNENGNKRWPNGNGKNRSLTNIWVRTML